MKFLKSILPILVATVFSAGVASATFYKWSQTAATDATADSTINWSEGQSPSSVNDSARAMMAALAKYRDDTSGSLVTGGTSTAYTLTTNQCFTSGCGGSLSSMDGKALTFRMNATSGATPTLNVDSLGAKALNQSTGVAVATGALISGAVYKAVYVNATSEWIVEGIAGQVPSGTTMLSVSTACPTGWTIATSNTDRALVISSSGGGTTAGTTAFSTYYGGSTGVGATSITQAMLPNYDLGVGSLSVSGTVGAIGGTNTNIGTTNQYRASDGSGGAVSQTPSWSGSISGSIFLGGSGQAHTHTIPSLQSVTAIACTKN